LKFKYGKKLSTKETANYMRFGSILSLSDILKKKLFQWISLILTRSEMAHLLRKSPFYCFCVLAGYDTDGPALYWIDYLATMHKVKTAAQGYIKIVF